MIWMGLKLIDSFKIYGMEGEKINSDGCPLFTHLWICHKITYKGTIDSELGTGCTCGNIRISVH